MLVAAIACNGINTKSKYVKDLEIDFIIHSLR
jgi:hypothetical protein